MSLRKCLLNTSRKEIIPLVNVTCCLSLFRERNASAKHLEIIPLRFLKPHLLHPGSLTFETKGTTPKITSLRFDQNATRQTVRQVDEIAFVHLLEGGK